MDLNLILIILSLVPIYYVYRNKDYKFQNKFLFIILTFMIVGTIFLFLIMIDQVSADETVNSIIANKVIVTITFLFGILYFIQSQ